MSFIYLTFYFFSISKEFMLVKSLEFFLGLQQFFFHTQKYPAIQSHVLSCNSSDCDLLYRLLPFSYFNVFLHIFPKTRFLLQFLFSGVFSNLLKKIMKTLLYNCILHLTIHCTCLSLKSSSLGKEGSIQQNAVKKKFFVYL